MQQNNAMRGAIRDLKRKYQDRHGQLNEVHRKAMNELKKCMLEETKEKITFDRYEKIDDIYSYEFHLYPKNKEDLKAIYDYCVKELNWIKKINEASNSGKGVEIIDDEYVAIYLRYIREDVRQTGKEYDKEHEINIKNNSSDSFFSSISIDYMKVKQLEGREIKLYDETCEAYPKKVTVEKVDLSKGLIYFSKEVALGGYMYNYGSYGSKILDIKLLASTKIYDENYQPNYNLPEESDEFSSF